MKKGTSAHQRVNVLKTYSAPRLKVFAQTALLLTQSCRLRSQLRTLTSASIKVVFTAAMCLPAEDQRFGLASRAKRRVMFDGTQRREDGGERLLSARRRRLRASAVTAAPCRSAAFRAENEKRQIRGNVWL